MVTRSASFNRSNDIVARTIAIRGSMIGPRQRKRFFHGWVRGLKSAVGRPGTGSRDASLNLSDGCIENMRMRS